jgi:methyl-accepting chemotaxis protein
MTIAKKLFSLYGLTMALTLVMGSSAIYLFQDASAGMQKLVKSDSIKLGMAGELDAIAANIVSSEQSIMLRATMHDAAGIVTSRATLNANMTAFHGIIERFHPLLVTVEGKAMVDKLDTLSEQLSRSQEVFFPLIDAGNIERAQTVLTTQLLPIAASTSVLGDQLMEREKGRIAQSGEDLLGSVVTARWISIVLMLLSASVGIFLYLIIRKLDTELRQSAQELSEGSDQVSSAATEVSSSSQSLAQDTSEQAAMIEETSASAEEINSMAKRNAESAKNATSLVTEAVQGTEQTNRAVADCVQAMDAIGESSSKIAKTLQVIDKIAFQTNILALNAAVEAARAGEAGMGFAVVAEEVRNLAQRCAAASEEISALIEQSLGNSDAGRIKMATLVESGAKVNQVFASMKVLVEEISLSSEEQGRGIDQIGRAIQKMEQGTQKSAANAEQSAAAAEQLTAQSQQLREVASGLGAMVGILDVSNRSPSGQSRTSKTSSFSPILPVAIRPSVPKSRPHKSVLATASHNPFPMDDDSNFTAF